MRVLAVMLVFVVCAGGLSAKDHDSSARKILDGDQYRGYRVVPAKGRDGQPNPDRNRGSDGRQGSGDAGEDGPHNRRGTGSREAPRPESGGGRPDSGPRTNLNPPAWLGTLLQVIFFGVLIIAGLVIVFFIVKALLGMKFRKRGGSKSKSKKKKKSQNEDATDEPELDEIPSAVFADALQEANAKYQRALSDQDWALATLLRYRIFWLRAGWRGCVEDEDVRTWREALAMVRVGATRETLRGRLGLVERVRYNEHRPDRDEFERWRSEMDTISSDGVIA